MLVELPRFGIAIIQYKDGLPEGVSRITHA